MIDELPSDDGRDEHGVPLVRRQHICKEPVAIGGEKGLLAETLKLLKQAQEDSKDLPDVPCWNAPRGFVCRDRQHFPLDRPMERVPCQRARVEQAIADHRALLVDCKFYEKTGPVAVPLWRALEDRHVEVGCGEEVYTGRALANAVRAELPNVPLRNAFRYGQRGSGKTHHSLIERFYCLERGIASIWLPEARFIEIIALKESTDSSEKARGHGLWQQLLRSPVVFLDDLGVDDNPPKQRMPGRPLLQTHLITLLTEQIGVTRVTTNRDEQELNEHPDCGGRALSRLMAPHRGKPALVWHYGGEDQRIWESQNPRRP